MICKALEAYIITRHGAATWDTVRQDAKLDVDGFETMLVYPDALFADALAAAGRVLSRHKGAILEDVGAWIVTHPPLEPVRRLFRFSGATFLDFLYSLDDVDGRGRLALPDLMLPQYRLLSHGGGDFTVRSRWSMPGAGAVLGGVLRAMSDDYGVLAIIDTGRPSPVEDDWVDEVYVSLFDMDHQQPRAFFLGQAP